MKFKFKSGRAMAVIIVSLIMVLIYPGTVQADNVDVSARTYILIDADSGQVLLAQDEHMRLPPASMTKLMTMILAVEDLEEGKVGLKDRIVASEEAWKMGGSQIYLEPGEEMTFEDMLIAIAVGSANDACVAVAEHLEGSHQNFVDRMNQKAKDLALKDTHFVNAYGLPGEEHYSSAFDMAVLAREAMNHPKILEYCSIKEYNLREGKFKLFNTNKLLWWYPGADGFKTGWTNEAKHCLTATAKRDGLRLISVVMASPENQGNFQDAMKLFNNGFARYAYKSFFAKGNACGMITVGKGTINTLEVVAEEDVGSIYLKGEEKNVTMETQMDSYVNAPVHPGQKLGYIEVYHEDQLVKQVNLIAADEIPRAGLLKEILKMFAETYLI